LVGGRFCDLLTRLFDGDSRPAKIRHRRQVGELAQYVVEDIQAVADGELRACQGLIRAQVAVPEGTLADDQVDLRSLTLPIPTDG